MNIHVINALEIKISDFFYKIIYFVGMFKEVPRD